MTNEQAFKKIEALSDNIEKVIIGKKAIIHKALACMLAKGHIILEDVPGVGKTQLALAICRSVNGRFSRIQLTPDVMPSDLAGYSVPDPETGRLVYKEGAVMCNFLLADEINRSSPKTQSGLLEAMEEHSVSVDGTTIQLPNPFMVLATQNPIETFGTYHLPEAQMDRFMMKLSLGYPTAEKELTIMNNNEKQINAGTLSPVMDIQEVVEICGMVSAVTVTDNLKRYILDIVGATRENADVLMGVSPRGSIALMNAAKGFAFVKGRTFVAPDEIKQIAADVLAHRIILSPVGKSKYKSSAAFIQSLTETINPLES